MAGKKFDPDGKGVIIEDSRTNVQQGVCKFDEYSLMTYYNSDARNMEFAPDESVDFILTSPPYNAGIKYNKHNDSMPLDDYLIFVREFLTEYYRVLKPDGRMAIVIANVGRKPYINNVSLYTDIAEDIGFKKRGEIIWVKGDSPNSTGWGSYKSASDPSLRDSHEYILVFNKDLSKKINKGESTIDKDLFLSCSNSVWRVNPTTKKRAEGHPAAFPIELAERLIQFYTYKEDIVLDPMCGYGSTCLAADKLGRKWIGNDVDLSYVNARLQKESNRNNRQIKRDIRTDKHQSIGLTPAKLRDQRIKVERSKKKRQKVIVEES